MIEPCPRMPCGSAMKCFTVALRVDLQDSCGIAEQFNTVTTCSASCRCWKYFFYLTVGPSCIFQSVKGRLKSTSITTESRSSTALPAPYQYQTLQVVLLS